MAEAPVPILEQILESDGFWPSISVRDWVDAYAVPTSGRDGMLLTVLEQAMADANEALKAGQAAALAAGFASAADYAEGRETLNGQPLVVMLYRQAVGNRAKALTLKLQQSAQRRPANDGEAAATDNQEAHFLDQYQRAIARILADMAPAERAGVDYGFYVGLVGDNDARR